MADGKKKKVLDWRQIFESFAKSLLAGENDKNPIFFGVERIKTENLHQHYTTSTALVPGHHEPKSFKNINQKGDDFCMHPDKKIKSRHTQKRGEAMLVKTWHYVQKFHPTFITY